MAQSSYAQSSFRGGFWSGFAQGRTDDPRYPFALARNHNAVLGEEESWLRRSGFLYRWTTKGGDPAVLRAWRFSQTAAYVGEFSARSLRFWSDQELQFDNFADVTAISTANPSVLTIDQTPDNWLTGDEVRLYFDDITSMARAPALAGRALTVTLVTATTVTLKDSITGTAISGAAFSGAFTGAALRHVLAVRTPYEEDEIQAIRKVQSADLNVATGTAESKVTFLHSSHQPQSLVSTANFGEGLIAEEFEDGPYMDPPSEIVSLVPSDTDGLITLTLSSGAATWLIGTTYDKGDVVSTVVDGTSTRYWISLHDGNVGNSPGGIGGGIPMDEDWCLLPRPWSGAITYAYGAAVLDVIGQSTRVFFSLIPTNIDNEPSESPAAWSLTAPTWDATTSFVDSPVWVTYEGALWVGTQGNGPGTGPPFDPPPDEPTIWVDGLTPYAIFQLFPNINGGRGFLDTDVGRCIRLLAGPEPWDVATTYGDGDLVNFENNTFEALAASTGVQPDLNAVLWEIQAVGPTWTWARIAYVSQPVTETITTWAAGSFDTGDIVAWGLGADGGDPPTNAYVSRADSNTNVPPTDPTVLVAGNWLRVGTFIDFDVVPQVIVEVWSSSETYDQGSLVYVDGDTVLYAASDNGLDSGDVPGVSPLWIEVVAVEATTIGSSTQIYAKIEGNPLPNTDEIWLWQLGLYSDTTGWPTSGCYHEGRLWLAGPIKNRFDASVSNDPFNFEPTTPDGTVADRNSISRVFNFEDQNDIFWIVPDGRGLLMGTLAGLVLVSASELADPLTPTSTQAKRVNDMGYADIEPEHSPSATLAVHSRRRKLLEVVESNGKYVPLNMTQMSAAITEGGVEEIAYQAERLPVLWGRTADNELFGVSYKRDPQQEYVAAQTHEHGAFESLSRDFFSIAVQVDAEGTSENLWAITVDENDVHYVEMQMGVFEEDAVLNTAMMVDTGVRPSGAKWISGGSDDGSIKFYGLWPHATMSDLAVFIGIDLGDLPIAVDGTLTIAFGSVEGFTPAALIPLISVAADTTSGPGSQIVIDFTDAPFEDDLPPLDEGEHYEIAAVVGYPYDSEGQLLRPLDGAQNGPAFGKSRRNHKAALQLWRTHEIKVGPTFDDLQDLSLREEDDSTPIGAADLYSGIVRDSIEGKHDFDGQLAWRITRPMPGALLQIGGFFDPVDI